MRTVRSIAMAITLAAGGAVVVAPVVGNASPSSCPKPTHTTGDTQAAAREVTEYYPTIQAAAAAVGVPMASNRQVIAVMAYPTFVDTRVVAADDPCRVIGVLVNTTGLHKNAPGNPPLVWTPPFPTFSRSGVGERFVSSTAGSITIEFRDSPSSPWRRFVATSTAMRWTAAGAPVTGASTKAALRPISAQERSEFGAAINRTLSAKSVRIDVRWPSGDGTKRSITLNRPDRARTETALLDGGLTTSISIGRASYAGEMFDGGSRFEVRAQLTGGRVAQLTVTLTSANPMTKPRILPVVTRLTKFDSASTVVAPPDAQTGEVRRA